MKAFVERINATLPTEEPDYILLALVRGTRDKVCGATCPAGQGLADGRCMPNAILAGKKAPQISRAARTDSALAISSSSATRTPTEAAPSDAARMGLAGPLAQNSQPPTADPNAPAQSAPAPAAAHRSAASRRADAKRAAAQGGGFTLNFFSQLGKLGY
jgi:hypothetical protein